MPTVVGVRLRSSPRTFWFDPVGIALSMGQAVIVETDRGTEFGEVVEAPHEVDDADLPAALKPVLRPAAAEDLRRVGELADKEEAALPAFREAVEKSGLDIKAVDVEYLFSGDKAIFYFTADERVDFRELVRDLAAKFKIRVDMRQIGVRDEARLVGGIGHCGQPLCCVRFGGDFQPVSIRMAKEQDLPLNPLKISGLCGRLMCCLRYEYDAYRDFKSRSPKRGAMVDTPIGPAKVTDLNTPRELVTMRTQEGTSVTVPLASMSCSKDSSCPCLVEAEAFALASGPRQVAATVLDTTPAAPTGASARTEAGVAERPGGARKRRDRGRGERPAAASGSDAAKAEKPAGPAAKAGSGAASSEQQPGSKAGSGEPGTTTPTPSGQRRRRRRRRPSGGGAGGGAGGGEQVQ